MIALYSQFSDESICSTVLSKLSWSHLIELIRVDNELRREFYINLCIHERWSVRTLTSKINSLLFERTVISKKPDAVIKRDLQELRNNGRVSLDIAIKDPYILDFLELPPSYSEKQLEQAILNDIEKFLLELGTGFSFIARQKRIIIDGKDFYIDLLFFHRSLQRLIVIELKLGEFEYAHKSQMELYLNWLSKHEKKFNEGSPIGLLLCTKKNQETIELLKLDESGIHVSEYLTELPPKEVLKKKLQESIARSKLLYSFQIEESDE